LSLGKFETVTLADVSINNKGEYGIGASAVDYSDELYTYLRITDINDDGTLNKNDLKSVDDDDAKNYLLNENDVVFARTGNSTGKAYYYDKMDGELVYAGFLIKFSLDPSKINPKFMKYYVLSEEYKGWVNSMCTGSTRPNINAKMYGNMELILPPREQQDFLVNILDKIDKKIEINKRINKNLEQLINTIFYNWFISFDKFKNLKFKNSELGDIPEEWNCGILRDILTLIKNPIKAAETNGLPYLPIDIIPMNSLGISELKSDEEANSSLITFDKNDILIGAMRVYFHRVVISPCFGVTRSTCFVLKPKKKEYLSYLLLLCNLDQTIQYAQNTSKGTTMPYAVWDNGLGDMDIIIPPDNVLKEFHVLVFPIIEKIRDSYNEINKLQKLRDTLLPKLMSGEIDVSKINCDLKNIIKTFIKKFKCILLKYYHERKIISKISLITLKFLFIFLLRFIKSSILSNIIAIFF